MLSLVRQLGALCGPLGGGRARVAWEFQACMNHPDSLQAYIEVAGGAQAVKLDRADLPTEDGAVVIEAIFTESQRECLSRRFGSRLAKK